MRQVPKMIRFGSAGLTLAWAFSLFAAGGGSDNIAPTVQILKVEQRPETTIVDIYYRVDDPDDATVQTAALAFIDGEKRLDKVLRLQTLVEGTDQNLGPNVPANTELHVAWDIGKDWDVDYGKFVLEIYAKDQRSPISFHWITFPQTDTTPQWTISQQPLTPDRLQNYWYWLIATDAVDLVGTEIRAKTDSIYHGWVLAKGNDGNILISPAGWHFLAQRLNLRWITPTEWYRVKDNPFRYGLVSDNYCYYAIKDTLNTSPRQVYQGGELVFSDPKWVMYENLFLFCNKEYYDKITICLVKGNDAWLVPGGVLSFNQPIVKMFASPKRWLVLLSDGSMQSSIAIPSDFHNLVNFDIEEIFGGCFILTGVKDDGTLVVYGHGGPFEGWERLSVPDTAQDIESIWGDSFDAWPYYLEANYLALKRDGSLISWRYEFVNEDGWQKTIKVLSVPSEAMNIKKIIVSGDGCMVLREDGKVISWDWWSQKNITPISIGEAIDIAVSQWGAKFLALRKDKTVVEWDWNGNILQFPKNLQQELYQIIAIGSECALRADGMLFGWWCNPFKEDPVEDEVVYKTEIPGGPFEVGTAKFYDAESGWAKDSILILNP